MDKAFRPEVFTTNHMCDPKDYFSDKKLDINKLTSGQHACELDV